jgi:hypothetical protein
MLWKYMGDAVVVLFFVWVAALLFLVGRVFLRAGLDWWDEQTSSTSPRALRRLKRRLLRGGRTTL